LETPGEAPPYPAEEEGVGDDPEYGALLHELDSASPLVMQDDRSVGIEDLLAGEDAPTSDDAQPEYINDMAGGDPSPAANRPAVPEARSDYVLTIEARSHIQTEQERQEIIWHEIRNSHIAGRILTGTLSGVEQTKSGLTIAVVDYKGFRIAIPIKEMMLYGGQLPHGAEYGRLMDRLNRILVTMMGAEIDFIVRGIDKENRSVAASRKAAMLRKRQTFYLDTNEQGTPMIYEGRVVQARVIGVAEKVLRVEVFGVECAIFARDLSWTWFGDAREQYSVGDRVLVRVQTIDRPDVNRISITADVRSVSSATSQENLKKIMPQCRYMGQVTDFRNGVAFIRLNNGVNAIAHTCYDRRMPGKKDDVSFAVTRLDEERGIAVGIITRIIKQNL
jgi:ribosomal protein S1